MPHQYHIVEDYHEEDALDHQVVLTDSNDEPISTTADWEARYELLEETTSESSVFEKLSQDGDITFETLTDDDISGLDNVTNTDGDKAVVAIQGEGTDGTSGDTADLLGTGTERQETVQYVFALRVWNAAGRRVTTVTGVLEINAPGVA